MTTLTFDTLKASDNLKAAGLEAAHANAIVHTVADAFGENVATKTKADLAELKADLKADMAELKGEIGTLKAEMFRALRIQGAALVGLQLTIAGLLFAALKTL